jgi:hypothetical protein
MTLPKELRQLERAFDRHAKTRDELQALIREAQGKGWSLRRIAAVTGISHEQVRRIVNG